MRTILSECRSREKQRIHWWTGLKQLVKEISAEWTWGVWFTTATFFWQNWPNKVSKDIIRNTSSRPFFSDASSATGLNWPKKVGKDISFKPLRCNIDSPNGHFDKGMQALTMTEEDGQGQFCIALAPRLTQLITTDMRLFLIDLYGMQSCEIIHCGVHLARSNQPKKPVNNSGPVPVPFQDHSNTSETLSIMSGPLMTIPVCGDDHLTWITLSEPEMRPVLHLERSSTWGTIPNTWRTISEPFQHLPSVPEYSNSWVPFLWWRYHLEYYVLGVLFQDHFSTWSSISGVLFQVPSNTRSTVPGPF